jgi:hypothetical protein
MQQIGEVSSSGEQIVPDKIINDSQSVKVSDCKDNNYIVNVTIAWILAHILALCIGREVLLLHSV